MNRKEFMEKLSWLLGDLPEEEKEEALNYYENYFEDAGPQNEAEVIAELGSPEKVACMIRNTSENEQEVSGVFTDTGYEDTRFQEETQVPGERFQEVVPVSQLPEKAKRKWNWNLILLVLIVIFAVPILGSGFGGVFGGIVAVVFGIVFGVIGIVFGGLAALAGGTAALVGKGIQMLGSGTGALLSANYGNGFLKIALGCFCLALGILAILLLIYVVTQLIPRFLRWIIRGLKRLINKRKEPCQ